MAAQVLPVTSPPSSNFLDSPVFKHSETMSPPAIAYIRSESPLPMSQMSELSELRVDAVSCDMDDSDNTPLCSPNTPLIHPETPLCSPSTPLIHPETPDSGFSGLNSSTPALKTPDSEHAQCDNLTDGTPSSAGTNGVCRKRKQVLFDESQTSVVVISHDDLFKTYSKIPR